MTINKKSTIWICEECGYRLLADEFENDYVFWFCDKCKTYLNNQEGFQCTTDKQICTKCRFENDTTFDNIKGMCSGCGKIIPDLDGTLCVNCLLERRRKNKERLIVAGKVLGVVAVTAGLTYLATRSNGSGDDEEEYNGPQKSDHYFKNYREHGKI